MKRKSGSSRREFIAGSLAAGAAFAFDKMAGASQNGDGIDGSDGIPFVTEKFPQPEDGYCFWVGLSPVNDQTAFLTGTMGNVNLYVNSLSQPGNFDLLKSLTAYKFRIYGCAWSPNGREIAFLTDEVYKQDSVKTAKASIYIADVDSKDVRKPVDFDKKDHIDNVGRRQFMSTGHKDGLAWCKDCEVCVPMSDGSIVKFNTNTGECGTLLEPQNETQIRSIAATRLGELRFVRTISVSPEGSADAVVCGLKPDGTISEYVNLKQKLGKIFFPRLSQNGDFVFVENDFPQFRRGLPPTKTFIYKIENNTVIGEIPQFINYKGDMFSYIPVAVRNDKEVILIEADMLVVDGDKSMRNTIVKAAKITLL